MQEYPNISLICFNTSSALAVEIAEAAADDNAAAANDSSTPDTYIDDASAATGRGSDASTPRKGTVEEGELRAEAGVYRRCVRWVCEVRGERCEVRGVRYEV